MIKVLRFLRIAFSLSRMGGAWAEDSEWTEADAVWLRSCLSCESGKRLRERLRNASIRMNARAVLSSDPAGEGRKASGYMVCIEDLSALAAPQVREDTEEEALGADFPLEQIAP